MTNPENKSFETLLEQTRKEANLRNTMHSLREEGIPAHINDGEVIVPSETSLRFTDISTAESIGVANNAIKAQRAEIAALPQESTEQTAQRLQALHDRLQYNPPAENPPTEN